MFFITVICRYVSGLTSDELEPQEEEEQLPNGAVVAAEGKQLCSYRRAQKAWQLHRCEWIEAELAKDRNFK